MGLKKRWSARGAFARGIVPLPPPPAPRVPGAWKPFGETPRRPTGAASAPAVAGPAPGPAPRADRPDPPGFAATAAWPPAPRTGWTPDPPEWSAGSRPLPESPGQDAIRRPFHGRKPAGGGRVMEERWSWSGRRGRILASILAPEKISTNTLFRLDR